MRGTFNQVVEKIDAELDSVFRALGDSSRRMMLERLSAGTSSIGELAAPLDMSFEAASKHVRVLESAGLVRRQVCGRRHECSLRIEPLERANAWLATYRRFWRGRLDALASVVEGDGVR